jgi:hypothetical protein
MSRALHIYRTYLGQHTALFGELTIAGQLGHLLFRY